MDLHHLFLLTQTFPKTTQLNTMEILYNGNLQLWHVCSLFTIETCKDSMQYFMLRHPLSWIITATLKNFLVVMALFNNQSINNYFLSKMFGGHKGDTRLSYYFHCSWMKKPNVGAWSSTSEYGASGTYLPFDGNGIASTIHSIKLVNWCCLELSRSWSKVVAVGLAWWEGWGQQSLQHEEEQGKDAQVSTVGVILYTSALCI